jgi:hypothetical protein
LGIVSATDDSRAEQNQISCKAEIWVYRIPVIGGVQGRQWRESQGG